MTPEKPETVTEVLNEAVQLMASEIRAIRKDKGQGRIGKEDRGALLELVRELRGIEHTRSQLAMAVMSKLGKQAAEDLVRHFFHPHVVRAEARA